MKVYLKARRLNSDKLPMAGTNAGPYLADLCGKAKAMLEAAGHEVLVSGPTETSGDAIKRCDAWGGDLYIALYINDWRDNAPLAWTCGHDPLAPSSVLCRLLVQEVAKIIPARGENLRYPREGVKYSDLKDHEVMATSAVIKLGCNSVDGDLLVERQDEIAKAISNAVELYAKAKEGIAVVSTEEPETDDDDPETADPTDPDAALIAKIVAMVLAARKA